MRTVRANGTCAQLGNGPFDVYQFKLVKCRKSLQLLEFNGVLARYKN